MAYVNVGQAEEYRDYWDGLDKEVILGEDPNWSGNYYANANDERWHNAILNEEIPDILNQNAYDGVVLVNKNNRVNPIYRVAVSINPEGIQQLIKRNFLFHKAFNLNYQ